MTTLPPASVTDAARPQRPLAFHKRAALLLLVAALLSPTLIACSSAQPQGEAGGIAVPAAENELPATPDEAAPHFLAPTATPVTYVRADGVQVAALPALLPGARAPLPAAPADLALAANTAVAMAVPVADTAPTEPVQPAEPAPASAATTTATATRVPLPSVTLTETTNILVLGSDRREGEPNWRTDVMMIVALDEKYGRAGVISIPRDIFIEQIPGHAPNKINVLDYLGERDSPGGGGPELVKQILFEKMGIRIDHWVRFDFTGFVDLVDALGGVDVEIDCAYYDYFQIENVILNVKPGIQRLTGDEALVYVRSRKIGGDLDRARRQQRFLWAVRNQVLSENILPKLPALYNALGDSVQTDLGIVGTLKVARFAVGLDREEITGFVIGYPLVNQGYAGNMWVFRADWEAIRYEAQHVFDRDPFLNTNTLAECP